jgi:hypothetical protein
MIEARLELKNGVAFINLCVLPIHSISDISVRFFIRDKKNKKNKL